MTAPVRNLINLTGVGKEYASRTILADVSLGVGAGERIGIVGRNGDGKSTLLRLMAGIEEPDGGVVTRSSGFDLALVGQGDELDPTATIRHELVGDRDDHEWAGDPRFRSVLDGLLGGVELNRFPNGIDTVIGPLSGGERRRIALAKSLIDSPELLLLDEPTNHLDLEAVDWLARHLAGRRGKSLVVITHDRWFLDAVVEQTWEVTDTTVHQYEGGYAAYVLARAERDRQQASRDTKRVQLVKKELAWLRRGPPARTSKPKFRIEAANALIDDVPPLRDSVELVRFASARLGSKVIDAEHVGVRFGERVLLDDITWRLGPGDRLGLVGVNGAGKSSLIRVLTGDLEPTSGSVDRGATVRVALLSQDTAEIPGHLRVLEALEEVRQSTRTSDGTEVTAGKLAERFGFRGSRAGTLVKDLSGGERRRLQLMRLLMTEPNVLILDEPTNDLDIDTLTALEDLLDSWAGTLVVVSHDRYFVERVTDNVHAIVPGGRLRHLPGGIEQYVEIRRVAVARGDASTDLSAYGDDPGDASSSTPAGPRASGAEIHAARKSLGKLERAITKLDAREAQLHEQMGAAASDYDRLRELTAELTQVRADREAAETAWLEATELVEG